MVLRAGFEPARPQGHHDLNVACLPFHHLSTMSKYANNVLKTKLSIFGCKKSRGFIQNDDARESKRPQRGAAHSVYTWRLAAQRLTFAIMTTEQRLEKFLQQSPQIDDSAYVASGAVVIGAVKLGPYASVWHNCVLRGDINSIDIGEGSNVQDGSVVHLADDYGVSVGKYVTIGHMAMIHACSIGDECLIGMHATILDGAVIGAQSIVGAGALVTKGTQVPAGSLVLGAPAKVVRPLSDDERAGLKSMADKYVIVSRAHKQRQTADA